MIWLTPLAAFAIGLSAQQAPADVRVVVSTVEELQRALVDAGPGTTIALAPGEYRGGIAARGLRGEEGRPIVIAASDPDRPPVIRGGGSGLQLSDPSHVEIRDLVVEGAADNGVNIDDGGTRDTPAIDVVLRNLQVRDVGPEGNHDGIKLSGVDAFQVENCTIERWGSGGSGIDMVGCHRGVIVGCTLRDGGSSGVQAKGGTSNVDVRRCRFEDAGERALNLGGSTGTPFFRPDGAGFEARDLVVEDCVVVGSEAGVAFVGVDGAEVRHCLFVRPGRYAIRILQESRGREFIPCRDGRFEQNIIVFRSNELAMTANVGSGTAPETFTIARNVWYCLDDPSQSHPPSPLPESEGRYGVDPMLGGLERGGLTLPPDSPARPAGPRDHEVD